ncbi:MAG: hypothetical protein IJU48_06410 [Synergistaceae bacterium]|nr:hypothetical protein [Synergistaceae bacterium]
MSIQNISSGVQNSELYVIRKRTDEQKAEQAQQAALSTEQVQADEYDKANPVGEEVEGIYSVSHDEDGNLKVDYKQPASKSDDTGNSQGSGAKSQGAGQAGGTQATTSTDDDDDEELEKLKKQRDQIKQQLNRETDEKVKAQLRVQLQNIEMQIALKSSQSN